MTATNKSIWMRLGVSVFGNAEEIDKVLNGEQPQLIKLLREGKFEIYGDTYIPDASIDDYNQTNGTHYAEQEVEFDLNFKSAEHHNKTVVDAKSAEYLSKDETIVRICPDTKLPVLVCHEGEGRCLCLHNDSAKEDRQAINNWLSANVETIIPENREVSDEDDSIETILENTDKCERFAEVVLDEIRTDEEQPRHIGSNVIKAYLNGDCDDLLIALCGWSMDSLLNKFNDNKSDKLKICPECQEEALRYAMIDVDGTNLEEGYSCSECGANFIGLDNEQVIEANS